MNSELERKLKTALDESRLLILGAQVLFGFAFQGAFQDMFTDLPSSSRWVHGCGLMLLLLAMGCLITPSLYHQLLYNGSSRRGALKVATSFASASLLPFTIGLGCSVFVVFEQLFSRTTGILAGIIFTAIGLILLYGVGFALKRDTGKMPDEENETSLRVKIEQLLTEARVIIPGGQALLGFQLVAVLSRSFSELPSSTKFMHAGALTAVALSVALLMTPAALHRIAFDGNDNGSFFRVGSALVISATFFLAIGIAADVYVVFAKIGGNPDIAGAAGVMALAVLMALWFGYPMWARAQRPRP